MTDNEIIVSKICNNKETYTKNKVVFYHGKPGIINIYAQPCDTDDVIERVYYGKTIYVDKNPVIDDEINDLKWFAVKYDNIKGYIKIINTKYKLLKNAISESQLIFNMNMIVMHSKMTNSNFNFEYDIDNRKQIKIHVIYHNQKYSFILHHHHSTNITGFFIQHIDTIAKVHISYIWCIYRLNYLFNDHSLKIICVMKLLYDIFGKRDDDIDVIDIMQKIDPQHIDHLDHLDEIILKHKTDLINSNDETINEKRIINITNIECCICFDVIKQMISLPCGHIKFCESCINKLTKKTCPICIAKFKNYTKLYI
jgi:Zinc finger, C3HC4 type (RING finger)